MSALTFRTSNDDATGVVTSSRDDPPRAKSPM